VDYGTLTAFRTWRAQPASEQPAKTALFARPA
jgi:hypothetical protein